MHGEHPAGPRTRPAGGGYKRQVRRVLLPRQGRGAYSKLVFLSKYGPSLIGAFLTVNGYPICLFEPKELMPQLVKLKVVYIRAKLPDAGVSVCT